MLLQDRVVGGIDLLHQDVVAPEVGQVLQDVAGVLFLQQHAVQGTVVQDQAAVASEVDVHHLDVGGGPGNVVVLGQGLLDLSVAALVVDRLDAQVRLVGVIHDVEHAEMADQLRA